jgi:hypothetical protein
MKYFETSERMTVLIGSSAVSVKRSQTLILQGVTRRFPYTPSDKSAAASLCQLGRLLPLKETTSGPESEQMRLTEALANIEKISGDQPFLKLIAADVCFCLYRRIRVNNHNITKQHTADYPNWPSRCTLGQHSPSKGPTMVEHVEYIIPIRVRLNLPGFFGQLRRPVILPEDN